MKREIRCSDCKPKYLGLTLSEEGHIVDPYPGEHIKVVEGKSLFDCVCDSCNKTIQINDKCYAVSFWSDYGHSYYKWEKEYIRI